MNWKGCEGRDMAQFEISSQNLPGGAEDTLKNLSKDGQSSGLALNPASPKYKLEVTPTQLEHSVIRVLKTSYE